MVLLRTSQKNLEYRDHIISRIHHINLRQFRSIYILLKNLLTLFLQYIFFFLFLFPTINAEDIQKKTIILLLEWFQGQKGKYVSIMKMNVSRKLHKVYLYGTNTLYNNLEASFFMYLLAWEPNFARKGIEFLPQTRII